MRQLMHYQVLQAPWILLRQLRVKPDIPTIRVAGPPLGLHPLDRNLVSFHSHGSLPFLNQRGKCCLELSSIPTVEDAKPIITSRPFRGVEPESVAGQHYLWISAVLRDVEAIAFAPDVMALP